LSLELDLIFFAEKMGLPEEQNQGKKFKKYLYVAAHDSFSAWEKICPVLWSL